ncbi:MAG: TIGR00266 family protein, partial [Planctomycetota bacterium]|nr:TIGR00266 family protein [Planctomycetota bacterium]
MQTTIEGRPAFAYVHADLEPGETIIAESDAMSSMSAALEMVAKTNGGFFSGMCKKFLGGESLFVNHFTNTGRQTQRVTLVQATPGDVREVQLKGDSICLQPGAYICSTPGLKLGLSWAGFKSWFAKEGLFKLVVSGRG